MIVAACKSIKDNSDVLKYLISNGADVNIQDKVSINYHNFIIFIITFNLCIDIYYTILHIHICINET